jgi:hypothetical protein
MKRNNKGSIAAFLLMFAVFGLVFVLCLIASELFIKWVTFNRIQNAAQAASLAYAREMVKLRDNEMGEFGEYGMRFQATRRAQRCNVESGYSGCTMIDPGSDKPVTGVMQVEPKIASQILLFQLFNFGNSAIKDASDITRLEQGQCYTAPNRMRFSLFAPTGGLPTCAGGVSQVVSPIADLRWEFHASSYGTGVCLPIAAGMNNEKDFCVETWISGRLDPILAGGLPFLNGTMGIRVPFIADGSFRIVARSVVMMPTYEIDQGNNRFNRRNTENYDLGIQNFSTESIGIEACNSSISGPPCI